MGGQVVYLPKQPSTAENFGSGVSGGLSNYVNKQLDMEMKQKEYSANMQALQAMQRAGTREKALEIAVTVPTKNAEELRGMLSVIDHLYPPKDTTLEAVTSYDSAGGEAKTYVPKGRLGELNNPNKAADILGPGRSMTKPPDMVELYRPGSKKDTFDFVGKKPLANRSGDEFTLKEFEAQASAKSQARAADAAERSASNAERSGKREERNASSQEFNNNVTGLKAATTHLAALLNLKHSIGVNGDLIIDPNNDAEKVKAFYDASPNLLERVQQGKGDFTKAAQGALNATGYKPKEATPPPAAEVKKEEPGLASRAIKAVGSMLPGGKKDEEVETKAKATWGSYEPKEYDYKIENGQLFRKKKSKAK